MTHPLDRPIWTALGDRQAGFAIGDEHARRYRPDVNLLAAAADNSPQGAAGLAALVPPGGVIATIEPHPMPAPQGLAIVKQAILVQMVADQPLPPDPIDHLALGDPDAPDMLALATLTQPGPFVERTHSLGRFVGIRVDGRLVAMAGERMRARGFAEVSAVCTHPDFRGHGLAGRLTRIVTARMVAAGETPFLHSYADNHGAIALYEKLGFRIRRDLIATFLTRAD